MEIVSTVKTKEYRVIDDDGNMIPTVVSIKVLPLEVVATEVARGRGFVGEMGPWYHPYFRIVTNYVRHNLTDYDNVRCLVRHRIKDAAASMIANLYYDLIAEHYPGLAEYCEYKKKRLFMQRAGAYMSHEDFRPAKVLTEPAVHASIAT